MLRSFVALAIAAALARRGLKKKSLSSSGAVAAFAVGFLSFLASYRMGVTLILFYQSSSSLTKVGTALKKRLEAAHKEGGQRDAGQVTIFTWSSDRAVDFTHGQTCAHTFASGALVFAPGYSGRSGVHGDRGYG